MGSISPWMTFRMEMYFAVLRSRAFVCGDTWSMGAARNTEQGGAGRMLSSWAGLGVSRLRQGVKARVDEWQIYTLKPE